MTPATTAAGPVSWENWRAFDRGDPEVVGFELGLYTDARVRDELLDLGPYALLNLVAGPAEPSVGVSDLCMVLRASFHLRMDNPPTNFEEFNRGSYHGGWLDSEIAALLSLALGSRCMSGGMMRRFDPDDSDPRGMPVGFEHKPPRLIPPNPGETPQLPTGRLMDLGDARGLIGRYPELSAGAARELVRAARQYQQALWNADADPRISWLQLVSALEVAASYWTGKQRPDPIDQLRAAMPELFEVLEPSPELLGPVASQLSGLLGSTARFIAFGLKYCPDPPGSRPQWFALDWAEMERHLREVYLRRSDALHAGVPIPGPMCSPPRLDKGAWSETPGGSISQGDTVWPAAKIPMLLHTFAYIVGGALRSWWSNL